VSLYVSLQIQIDGLVSVELFDCSEEFGQFISIIEFGIEVFERVKDADEVSHDVRENGNTIKENKGTSQSLNITSRTEVTKTDS
jgi:hypothetical protein